MVSIVRKAALWAAVSTNVLLAPHAVLAETIFGAMAKAYANNPDLNAARAGLRATDEGVPIAKAGYRPQISASASGTLSRVDAERTGSRDVHAGQVGISITQTIFDGFQTLNNVRAAESDVFSSREALKAKEIQILLSAAQSYANIARDQQIVSIRRQNLAFVREQLNAAQARLDVGEGTPTDVSQAEAQLAKAQSLLVIAVGQLKQSEAVYVKIVGMAPRGITEAGPAKRGMPRSLDQAVATGLRENPQILAAQYAVDQAGFQVKSAEGTMLPGVELQGAVTRKTGNSGPGLDSTTASITARLEVPIYQGGAEYGQIRQTKEVLGKQRILVDSARASVQEKVVAAHAQLESARAQIQASRAQVSAVNLALQGVIEERNVGQRTTLDVLDALQGVLDAQELLARAQRDAVVASYALLAAMGKLTVQTQGLQVAGYRLEEHYQAVKDKWFGLRTVGGR
ncbi:TolC family outer membrane protein [Sinorhizobium medicae]|uniref:outer membrane channel protein TolC n=1 Tax=Sinorhizobium medicae TaxID=110321 RepID=UPI001294C0A8|nr:outer membrane channel protein TolC [Sinorhizobium medicae]MDX0495902.1 TolC family outer membrane protein [Sinorhizobium medicae]MDX0855063.1 TolC family outer membrane protein [Sinorhizobium medicae]MDX1062327.1 TolC family outer membrane protein [Sinorhizobium medicae]MDX1068589.1 TolC family outer membrane protein [Sinorhizobium medicae]MDX1209974.1 TolC family outer membrane protein [Sinorhizobium medicae]